MGHMYKFFEVAFVGLSPNYSPFTGGKNPSHQSNAVWRLEWLTMATGSTGPTDTTGPRL